MDDPRRPSPDHLTQQWLSQLMLSHCAEQAIYLISRLRIPDLVESGVDTIEAMAAETNIPSRPLRTLLDALEGIGIFARHTDGRYINTPASALLSSDSLSAEAARARYYGSSQVWNAWTRFDESIRSGKPAFELANGRPFYESLREDDELRAAFSTYIARVSQKSDAAGARSLELADARTVVDVGGGYGSFLVQLLRANPQVHGVLYDLPEVTEDAKRLLPADLVDRITVVGGDMRHSVPAGADVYVLKSVLCDWPDAEAGKVLHSCAAAMTGDARLITIERIASSVNDTGYERLMNLQMLLLFGGGGLRPLSEMRDLLESAHLSLTSATEITGNQSVLISQLAPPPPSGATSR
ncbi:methyltransferase [Micromonospora sp. FIMYZ51]|uniref:methyltransferase n=1 Tax=Micromonospora sp. FIMYZ51 TaxID=3051832 RepID=UPI00311FB7FF